MHHSVQLEGNIFFLFFLGQFHPKDLIKIFHTGRRAIKSKFRTTKFRKMSYILRKLKDGPITTIMLTYLDQPYTSKQLRRQHLLQILVH